MSQALATLSQEAGNCVGLAAVNAAIQTQLANIQTQLTNTQNMLGRVDRRVTRLTRRVTAMERRLTTRLDRIDNRLMACDQNAIARNLNRRAVVDTSPLHPLRSPTTNAAIPGFPRTLGDINTMNIQRLRSVLRALGQDTRGRAVVLRERLKVVVGADMQGAVWR
ncbi:hypothetical protein MAPG_01641 [Magnaporthiopsis poae ATCC 64411]|uniref:Uncharacterized protein n=1 Tax=Magnaporthiopsis poae (strain ATCC 64411 / 73-15) TaxID=644358 RepID=A0A0C4DP85_MAGP6|nr:hypothetical protein MAPG_01641 [Magnaporthiopsis poae ATCC 64411]